ncbi:hypothetical protein V1634_15125 [Plantactinospora veratri]|uniref:Uncharacterized protein n=1 Tax=Plantactinospora veratri TaxID=1436122 RepID=A0ABU7SEG2_9ACTN
MSVDLAATLARPTTLAALLAGTRRTLTELLGPVPAPELDLVADRRYVQGQRVDPGRRLDPAELAGTSIGDPIPAESATSPGTAHYEIDVPASGDGVWLTVIDHLPEAGGGVEAVFSPYRTCVGVVLATALALTGAELTGGEFVDEQIRMLRPGPTAPRRFVAATRLAPPPDDDFAAACERYLRQFPTLDGWPRSRSMR